ncbi:GNAT family N-acetyltransferase [bacterium]|nr:GNAT family N-acetyltransferase [bacterium]
MEYKKFIGLNDDTIKIRTSVFIDEQGFKDEFDEIDKTCSHIVLYDNEKPIATCRYFREGENYHIGRVAIIKEYRGKHLGNKIMQIAETEIRGKCKESKCVIEVSAQVRVSEFYEKLEYNAVGNIYFDEYCEHIKMVKEL